MCTHSKESLKGNTRHEGDITGLFLFGVILGCAMEYSTCMSWSAFYMMAKSSWICIGKKLKAREAQKKHWHRA